MQSQSTRCQRSWQCKVAVEGTRSCHIREDQVLQEAVSCDAPLPSEKELTVEACMRTGQPIFIAIITVDIESAEAIHALELREAIKRHFAGSGDEL